MALISARQLIGKTLYLKQSVPFYRLSDVIRLGDKAKPVSKRLKPGYFFVLDSYLTPTEQNNNYGFTTVKRSNYYFTWRGNDGNPYALVFNENIFDLSKLKEQGAKTTAEEIAEQQGDKQSPMDKFFDSLGKNAKMLLWVGVGIWGLGYLMDKKK